MRGVLIDLRDRRRSLHADPLLEALIEANELLVLDPAHIGWTAVADTIGAWLYRHQIHDWLCLVLIELYSRRTPKVEDRHPGGAAVAPLAAQIEDIDRRLLAPLRKRTGYQPLRTWWVALDTQGLKGLHMDTGLDADTLAAWRRDALGEPPWPLLPGVLPECFSAAQRQAMDAPWQEDGHPPISLDRPYRAQDSAVRRWIDASALQTLRILQSIRATFQRACEEIDADSRRQMLAHLDSLLGSEAALQALLDALTTGDGQDHPLAGPAIPAASPASTASTASTQPRHGMSADSGSAGSAGARTTAASASPSASAAPGDGNDFLTLLRQRLWLAANLQALRDGFSPSALWSELVLERHSLHGIGHRRPGLGIIRLELLETSLPLARWRTALLVATLLELGAHPQDRSATLVLRAALDPDPRHGDRQLRRLASFHRAQAAGTSAQVTWQRPQDASDADHGNLTHARDHPPPFPAPGHFRVQPLHLDDQPFKHWREKTADHFAEGLRKLLDGAHACLRQDPPVPTLPASVAAQADLDALRARRSALAASIATLRAAQRDTLRAQFDPALKDNTFATLEREYQQRRLALATLSQTLWWTLGCLLTLALVVTPPYLMDVIHGGWGLTLWLAPLALAGLAWAWAARRQILNRDTLLLRAQEVRAEIGTAFDQFAAQIDKRLGQRCQIRRLRRHAEILRQVEENYQASLRACAARRARHAGLADDAAAALREIEAATALHRELASRSPAPDEAEDHGGETTALAGLKAGSASAPAPDIAIDGRRVAPRDAERLAWIPLRSLDLQADPAFPLVTDPGTEVTA